MKQVRRLLTVLIMIVIAGFPIARKSFGQQLQSQSPAQVDSSEQANESASKVSADLLEVVDDPAKADEYFVAGHLLADGKKSVSTDMIPVIVQTPGKAGRKLLQDLSQKEVILLDQFENVSAFAALVPRQAIRGLGSRADVSYVSLDRFTQAAGHLEATIGADQVRSYRDPSGRSIDGTGIGIAILDSGMYPNHQAYNGRVSYQKDFTGENRVDDPYGHGTHVASMAAGSSTISNGGYRGPALSATLINLRVLNSQGRGTTSNAIAAIDWCIANKAAYNIRVMNLSFGTVAVDSYVNDPLCAAVRRAVNAGIVVCVAAGNRGKDDSGTKVYGGINSPGIEPSAITVGAANTFGTDARSDDVVTTYSSRGPTRGYWTDILGVKHYDNIIKPDLVAPGNKIIAAESNNSYLATTYNLDAKVSAKGDRKMMYMSGTSVASPAVAGAAALVIQSNPNLTPNLVKAVLEYTAQPLTGFNNFEQGTGLLNAEGAVRLAGLIRVDLSSLSLGAALLVGAAPNETTTIAGQTFSWGDGIIQKWNFVYGSNLITRYQKIYDAGTLLNNGVLFSGGALLTDSTLLSNGVLLCGGVLISDGTILSNGTLFTNGVLLAGGVLLGDGTLMADGTIWSDSALPATVGQSVVGNGDATACMAPVL